MAKCTKINECAFHKGVLENGHDPLKYVWEDFCQMSPSRCARLRRHSLVPVSDRANRVSPLGFDLDTMMSAPRLPEIFGQIIQKRGHPK